MARIKIFNLFIFALSLIVIHGCGNSASQNNTKNEDSEFGYVHENSDPQAVTLANNIIDAMGGWENWQKTRYIGWEFFGRRQLLWDKETGNVRIEVPGDSMIYLLNVRDESGKVFRKGEEITNPDSLDQYITQGRKIWVNDSYWLVMPFKLKDPGVILSYQGKDITQNEEEAEVIELTYEDVGYTPQNKYKVYVDPQTYMVKEWAYYSNADQEEPDMVTPWKDFKKYGEIMLSGNRGQNNLEKIVVYDYVPESVFEKPDKVQIRPFG